MWSLLSFLFGDNVVGRLLEKNAIMFWFNKDKREAFRIIEKAKATRRRLIQLEETRTERAYRLFDDETGKPTSANDVTNAVYAALFDAIKRLEKRGLATYVDGTRSRPTHPAQVFLFKIE